MTKKEKQILKKNILSFLEKHPGKKFKSKTIARSLGITSNDYTQFRNYLRTLVQDGVIKKSGRNVYQLKLQSNLGVGKLRVKSQGYGFIQLEDSEQELFISQRNMGNALDGDVVAVQMFAQTSRGLLPEGRIDRVIERKRKVIVGTYKKGKYINFVSPDDMKIPWDIIVHDNFSKGAKPGQKVAVKIEYWENKGLNPTGKIVEILGFPKEKGVDIESILHSFNLSASFPKAIEEETAAISKSIGADDLQERLDLREKVCFTIDPFDARDFDDAVSLEVQEDGTYLLGVHIADVSHFVREGSKVDLEALKRATSVYLVDRVIPMLPEVLSNQICSLQPHQDRLTFTVLMKLDRQANLLDYQIHPSVINSKRRFNYEEAAEIINSGKGDFVKELTIMRDVSKILFKKRLQAGSLDFETSEIKIKLNETGKPIAIERKKRLETHQLVEEFMLLANKVVAEHVALRLPVLLQLSRKWPFIYRIHEKPDPKKMQDFANLVRSLGFKFVERKRIHSKQLLDVLHQVAGLPEEDIINQVMLRSLMKAKYDTKNVGHFGLAFQNYTHFTSPIRRYPDLVVHRLLKEYSKKLSSERISQLKQSLPEICRISSEQEMNAQEAERKSIKMKQAEFMADKLGEVYDGIISGIVPFGIFVEIVDFLVDGLVHVKDLTSDYYILDESNYRLVGKTTGKTYRLGDRVKVKVVRVVPEEKLIDFQLLEDSSKFKTAKRVRRGERKNL